MCWEKISTKKLHENGELTIEKNMSSGIYKWWAAKDELLKILTKLKIVDSIDIDNEIENKEIENKKMYCIYVGQATDLKERLKKHIKGSINNSTLRKSLGGILWNGEKADELKRKINDFMNELYVEYKLVDMGALNMEESDEISKSLRILNIDGYNHKLFMQYIDKPLSVLRKNMKTLEK